MLLSRLLGQEQEKQRQAREEFDRMVWDIVNKDKDNPGGGPGDGPDGPADGPAISTPKD